ncbi:MAG: glycosyltransferase family A protein [Candidatus Krumholzibacteriia bacterium]
MTGSDTERRLGPGDRLQVEAAPRVTVLVPAFNRDEYLPATLESVLRQTFTDWECLVVDDGSTDGTPAIAAAFAARDRRFRYERLPHNRGVSAARNRGVELARGEYVAFLDSDDLFAPDKLAWQVAALDAEPTAVLVYGETLQFRGDDPREGAIYLERLPHKPQGSAFEHLLCCSAIYAPLVRRDALRRTTGFDESLPWGEDWDAWLQVARLGRILHEPRVALHYRLHPGNASGRALESYRCAWRVARRHLRHVPWPRRGRLALQVWRYFRDTSYPARLQLEAEEQDRRGDWAAARHAWRAVALLEPRVLRRRRTLALVLWSLLPTRRTPAWRRRGRDIS